MREMAASSSSSSFQSDDTHLDAVNQKVHHDAQYQKLCSTLSPRHGQDSMANGVEEKDIPGDLSTNLHQSPSPSAVQQHVLFWDRDNDNVIYPQDVYTGFRELGFSIPFALLSLLIPVFFSYPTRLGHSFLPDPLFRIYVDSMHKAKHGSDTGIYDNNGGLRPDRFEEMFARFDGTGKGESLGVGDLFRLIAKNRVVADPAGWSFAFMEWSTTWLLLQREGRVWKEDLRQCYDGTLFWRIREARSRDAGGWRQGYGWTDFFKGKQLDDLLQLFVLTK